MRRQHGNIRYYETPGPDPARPYIENYALYPRNEPSGHPKHIFSVDGKKLIRRGVMPGNSTPCGILVDLNKVHYLFHEDEEMRGADHDLSSETSEDAQPDAKIPIQTFALAFLKHHGNVQAKGPLLCFQPVFKSINDRIMSPNVHAATEVVSATTCQMYADIFHRLSANARNIEAQQGVATAALMKEHLTKRDHIAKADKAWEQIYAGLPAETAARLLEDENLPLDLRIEHVVVIDMNFVRADFRNGRSVILSRLLWSLTRPDVPPQINL
jgi:hypothetical protein